MIMSERKNILMGRKAHTGIQHFRGLMLEKGLDMSYSEAASFLAEWGYRMLVHEDSGKPELNSESTMRNVQAFVMKYREDH